MSKKRFFQALMIFAMLFNYFGWTLVADAASYRGIVTGDSVNIRSGPGTNYGIATTASRNTQVNMVDTAKYSGTGCIEGWYYIYLPNSSTNKGYICAAYLKVEEGIATDKYLRPWLTPKLSIIGGAIFTGESYISKGQFTSYLIKYNVNPNSAYSLHTHQYMINIRAPYSQASSTYTSYSNSGMINQPLIFSIPVFNNMPAKTELYNYNPPNKGQTEITDEDFEAYLDAQKFPDHYKPYLRKIHTDHPNWVFEAMLTGINWDTAVSKQKAVGAIDSTDTRYCDASSGSCIKTEGNWYKPTTAATAFFLDPRNFMDERYILQFEKLSFSEIIKESDVQFVLNNTFMSGVSSVDGQTYASMFIEAGRKANVNPVYLASKSRQEVGVNGSTATSGKQFTYQGVTYQGLYNFYNIGAVSSAANPVLAGLVWAAGGSSIPIVNTTTTLELTGVENINVGLFMTELKKELDKDISNYTVKVVDRNNQVIPDQGNLGTGSKITVTTADETIIFNIVVPGDITGTGNINSADLLAIRKHLLGTGTLTGLYLKAADINGDGKVNSADLLALRQHLLGQKIIRS